MKKKATQQTVCWPDCEERRRILFIYLFIYLSIDCFRFTFVREREDGEYKFPRDEENFFRRGGGSGGVGGVSSVRSLQQCNILIYLTYVKVKVEETGGDEVRDYFSREFWIDGASMQLCILSIRFKTCIPATPRSFFSLRFDFSVSIFGPWIAAHRCCHLLLPLLPCHCLQGGATRRWRFLLLLTSRKRRRR